MEYPARIFSSKKYFESPDWISTSMPDFNILILILKFFIFIFLKNKSPQKNLLIAFNFFLLLKNFPKQFGGKETHLILSFGCCHRWPLWQLPRPALLLRQKNPLPPALSVPRGAGSPGGTKDRSRGRRRRRQQRRGDRGPLVRSLLLARSQRRPVPRLCF